MRLWKCVRLLLLMGMISAFFFVALREAIPSVSECVVLSTCNRTEVYFNDAGIPIRSMSCFLCSHVGVDSGSYLRYINSYTGTDAIRHLIRVGCGVDSMVVGEDEIYRQLKEAYEISKEAGMTGTEFNIIFRMAEEAVRSIKSETGISEVPVSVATLTANEVSALGLDEAKVLLLGITGDIGGRVAKNLLYKGRINLTATLRKHRNMDDYLRDDRIRYIPFDDRYKGIENYDVIISATKSPHYTITKNELDPDSFKGEKNHLFIDLAVPADIDEEIGKIEGCRRIDIDGFKKLSKRNNEKKLRLSEEAMSEADISADRIERELVMNSVIMKLPDIKSSLDKNGIDKLIYSIRKNCDAKEAAVIADWLFEFAAERSRDG